MEGFSLGNKKVYSFFLAGLALVIYIFENTAITMINNSHILNYIIKPGLWIGVALIIYKLPRLRLQSKIRFRTFISWWALNFAVIFIAALLMAGLIDGLGKSPFDHSIKGVFLNILLIGSTLVGRELIRSFLVNSLTKEENYLTFILIALFLTLISFSFNRFTSLNGYIDIIKFIAQYFGPEFSKNLFAVYLVFLGGAIPSIIFMGMLQAFHWLSPILPDLKWITTALIGILLPTLFLMVTQKIYYTESKQNKKMRNDEDGIFGWLITSIISIGLIWFSVGVFPVYPSVIATGSMEPMIMPGDVILVKRIDDINSLKKDDVIQFRRDDILISHRIIEIKDEKEGRSFRTKGDNNSAPDGDYVKPEQIKGRIIYTVPKIGWPTLLIKSKDDIPLEDVVF